MNDADLHSQEIGDSSFGDLASRRLDSSASCLFASVGRRFDLLSASWPPGPTRRNSSVASFVEHNPGVALPDAPIEPVARYEASGSTEIFTGLPLFASAVRTTVFVRTYVLRRTAAELSHVREFVNPRVKVSTPHRCRWPISAGV